ncbi:MAG: (d)CMP kinase [Streptosporangiaceae bacterium]
MTHSVTGEPGAGLAADGGRSRGVVPRGQHRAIVVAVDGPSGSGKSSAARGTATALGLRYLDTGAMYRAVTWWMLEHDVDLNDHAAVAGHTQRLSVDISTDPGQPQVRVDGIDVTAQIRNRSVSNVVSLVAAVPQVRRHLVAQQQGIVATAVRTAGGIVAEGRDIGTVVAPAADVKVFLTASEHVRAERRAAELAGRSPAGPAGRTAPPDPGREPGQPDPPDADQTRAEQAVRDRRDAPQSGMAADAARIDATDLGLDEVIAHIVGLVGAERTGA